MPKTDISLPNRSGSIDPRIDRENELVRQRDFLRTSQQRSTRSKDTSKKRSPAQAMLTTYRTLTGGR